VTFSILSRREAATWLAAYVLISALLVAVRFTSEDPDSALYAEQAARLAAEPIDRWIVPEWWGNWNLHGLFREHPAGVLLLPALLASFGVPGVQAAYIVGVGLALAAVILISAAIGRLSSRADGRAALVLLQLMPMAFIFRVRANHEYPMLVCLILAVIGIELAGRSWRWIWLTPIALAAAVLVKAVFVAVPLVAIAWWMLTNPLRTEGRLFRQVLALVLAAAATAVMIVLYDAHYVGLTGEGFWQGYWNRQLAPLSIGGSTDPQMGPLGHLGYYALRMLWHPAPWSLALIAAAVTVKGRWRRWWQEEDDTKRRALVFALGFAVMTTLALAPASRFAERYIFSPNYAIAAAGIVVALHRWPSLRTRLDALDHRVPSLPVVCWVVLVVGRLIVGPFLPRISG
jgi:4-amino-4-deoxy-L-arabinose transferase-like glycosyltransferase